MGDGRPGANLGVVNLVGLWRRRAPGMGWCYCHCQGENREGSNPDGLFFSTPDYPISAVEIFRPWVNRKASIELV